MSAVNKTPAVGLVDTRPTGADAVLVLDDGSRFWGHGVGVPGVSIGEVCFNTSITGYQEILTDPSYAGQIINFTFPHIGNVGATPEDMEFTKSAARGALFRMDITSPSNWRAKQHMSEWVRGQNLTVVTGIDTRQLTRHIRNRGAPSGVIAYAPGRGCSIDIGALAKQAADWPGLVGMDLAREVSCNKPYEWYQTEWSLNSGHGKQTEPRFHVVAIDYGVKFNILRCLASAGCRITVLPAESSAEDVLSRNPDGVFLSNGPGDPVATGEYAVPMIQSVLEVGIPLFGICLGHQMLALALGAKTYKMHKGHRGANQPVKDLETNRVEITSQNHGFCVDADTLPDGVVLTHQSLFDNTLEGIKVDCKPVFSVQYHPEASPGPHDSHYLFHRFIEMMKK